MIEQCLKVMEGDGLQSKMLELILYAFETDVDNTLLEHTATDAERNAETEIILDEEQVESTEELESIDEGNAESVDRKEEVDREQTESTDGIEHDDSDKTESNDGLEGELVEEDSVIP